MGGGGGQLGKKRAKEKDIGEGPKDENKELINGKRSITTVCGC